MRTNKDHTHHALPMCERWPVWGEWQKEKGGRKNPSVPEDGSIRPKHVVSQSCGVFVQTEAIIRRCSLTQYDAEVQHFRGKINNAVPDNI
jgi:hypothetical protein